MRKFALILLFFSFSLCGSAYSADPDQLISKLFNSDWISKDTKSDDAFNDIYTEIVSEKSSVKFLSKFWDQFAVNYNLLSPQQKLNAAGTANLILNLDYFPFAAADFNEIEIVANMTLVPETRPAAVNALNAWLKQSNQLGKFRRLIYLEKFDFKCISDDSRAQFAKLVLAEKDLSLAKKYYEKMIKASESDETRSNFLISMHAINANLAIDIMLDRFAANFQTNPPSVEPEKIFLMKYAVGETQIRFAKLIEDALFNPQFSRMNIQQIKTKQNQEEVVLYLSAAGLISDSITKSFPQYSPETRIAIFNNYIKHYDEGKIPGNQILGFAMILLKQKIYFPNKTEINKSIVQLCKSAVKLKDAATQQACGTKIMNELIRFAKLTKPEIAETIKTSIVDLLDIFAQNKENLAKFNLQPEQPANPKLKMNVMSIADLYKKLERPSQPTDKVVFANCTNLHLKDLSALNSHYEVLHSIYHDTKNNRVVVCTNIYPAYSESEIKTVDVFAFNVQTSTDEIDHETRITFKFEELSNSIIFLKDNRLISEEQFKEFKKYWPGLSNAQVNLRLTVDKSKHPNLFKAFSKSVKGNNKDQSLPLLMFATPALLD